MMSSLNEVTYNKTSVKCGQPFGSTEGEKLFVDWNAGVSMGRRRTWYNPERVLTDSFENDVLIY